MKKFIAGTVVGLMLTGLVVWAIEGRLEFDGDARAGVYKAQLVEDATSTGAQTAVYVPKGAHRHTILCDIQTGTITVRPEFSNDGQSTWIAGNDITADGAHSFDLDVESIRMNVTAISGGTVDCWWRVGKD